MPSMSFKSCLSTGHGDFPPTFSTSGSPDTFIGNLAVLREGDPFAPHTRTVEPHDQHFGSVSDGSSTCFVNNKKVARIGDPIDCSDAVAQGNPKCQVG